ncbi:dynein haevy chain 4, outer dynein arm beta [Monocercomonoides exilis]|uniref:dynein haevy chain 4, outer dynein arm beta n=1 Tax=Monocercomonoides exilis TaxID=2049356 RepID=UPI00355A42BF|nr:dynein haevy chain 4, outer dynein arm beta [Monocercomonoides exilis]|eukprot:MONOS_1998.1-p1 / transcript=MONOS_1998.1 / gene=MONOS_1998 / organism=Monocercomonoides_exilis_PA203 / gene_product=dynein haevy chain 4, outer dynein arm beta / transcript_product=dynein haevy chain 4, outer dynein arm beta / location=Mono_scaffold00038:129329-143297(-) / protein_length=4583 / sequence_SO=supercontig / SO=protein_coding / is_pseudo=false
MSDDKKQRLDPRIEWICDRVTECLKAKGDKLARIYTEEQSKQSINDFLEMGDTKILVVYQNMKDDLVASTMFPNAMKKKAIYFTKTKSSLAAEDMKKEVTVNDLASQPIEQLNMLIEEIFLPMAENHPKVQAIPEAIARDVLTQFHKLASSTNVIVGKTKGQTLLSLPQIPQQIVPPTDGSAPERSSSPLESEKTPDVKTLSKDFIHTLESSVIDWSYQIKSVIDLQVSPAFSSGKLPGPSAEIEFWKKKEENLQAIMEQLESLPFRRVGIVLERMKNSYFPAYKKIYEDTADALTEAGEVVRHLETLQPHLEKFNLDTTEYQDIPKLFVPILHTLLLIWSRLPSLRTPSFLSTLIVEVGNDLIEMTRMHADSSSLFKSEPPEALQRLEQAADTLRLWKKAVNTHAALSQKKFQSAPWRIDPDVVFSRIDTCIVRVQQAKEILNSFICYFRLEKIEIGGPKGEELSNRLIAIYNEFMTQFDKFQQSNYDCLDPEDNEFHGDALIYKEKSKGWERRLSAIVAESLETETSVVSAFKTIDSFEGLLDGEEAKQDLMKRIEKLFDSFSREVADAQKTFDSLKDNPPNFLNLPHLAGRVWWVRSLCNRVEPSMRVFQTHCPQILETVQGQETTLQFKYLMDCFNEYETASYEQWAKEIDLSSAEKLDLPLLRKEETFDHSARFRIAVNFDPALVALLREVRYLKSVNVGVPQTAEEIYAQTAVFQKYTGTLSTVVERYNWMVDNMLHEEEPLIRAQLDQATQELEPGFQELNWKSPGVEAFLSQVNESVGAVYAKLNAAHANLKEIANKLKSWATPMMKRDPKDRKMINPQDVTDKIAARIAEIKRGGEAIHALVEKNHQTFGEDVDKTTKMWKDYLKLVSRIIVEGLSRIIRVSLDHLRVMMQQGQDEPLFEIKLLLQQNELDFSPSITKSSMDEGSLRYMVKSWCDGFFQAAAVVNHLDQDEGENYFQDVSSSLALQDLKDKVMNSVEESIAVVDELQSQYTSIQFLWKQDPAESLKVFLRQGPQVQRHLTKSMRQQSMSTLMTQAQAQSMKSGFSGSLVAPGGSQSSASSASGKSPQERAMAARAAMRSSRSSLTDKSKPGAAGNDGQSGSSGESGANRAGFDDDSEDHPPTLADYEIEINLLKKLEERVTGMTDTARHKWLRADATKGSKDVMKLIAKWISTYTNHLLDSTKASLDELSSFIEMVNTELKREFTQDTLYEALRVLTDLRLRTEKTDAMFAPLTDTVSLLKKYGINVSQEIYQQLEDLPIAWSKLKRSSYNVKDSLQPMITAERARVQGRMEAFQAKVDAFRVEFRKADMFQFKTPPEKAYEQMDATYQAILQLEADAAQIQSCEEMLEITKHEYELVPACKTDLLMLKQVWDVSDMIVAQLTEWKKTPWEQVDTNMIDEQYKAFGKETRSLPKPTRAWDAYLGLDQTMKTFASLMPLVTQLRSPCMRSHHWDEVKKLCKKEFEVGPNFTLQSMVDLELHKVAEDVNDIVEKAGKELIIEKFLNDIDKIWKEMEISFATHQRTGHPILGSMEDLINQLDENQVQVANNMAQKHVGRFLEFLQVWQQKLSVMDQVINIWMEVQTTWVNLENIFIGSADIRSQLPEDSERFEELNKDWIDLMQESVKIPNAIECCTREGLYKRFQNLQGMLSLCEKSLQIYLETKRRAFPRFYFLSAADLLNILSEGTNPHAVQCHMPKLFDNMKCLIFQKKNEEELAKEAEEKEERRKLLAEGEVLEDRPGEGYTNIVIGMVSKEGEQVAWPEPLEVGGTVEVWLNKVVDGMRSTLRHHLGEAVSSYEEHPRDQFIFSVCAQIALVTNAIFWNTEVVVAFESLEEGNENALKDYNKKQQQQLNVLVQRTQQKLSALDRQKLMTVVTIDVHSRDVVANLIRDKVENSQQFAWVSQLRQTWDEDSQLCQCHICDANFEYSYEYLGNTARLVITPLTDRCYITLTQALHLIMGGSPAGPAGTGKTETVKDLGRALAVMMYVFNCSEQMDYQSLGNIFKGLASSGAWGCFDEFNRISVEVLSVVASQVKCILDAIRAKKERFDFLNEDIKLIPSCGIFITMNPGYAGRTELPENLKALFRPVSMVVPDFLLICEIMLMAEGFLDARELAKKFTTLYSLNKELLSKQDHYDWGLRAIKSVLVVAGSLKRADPDLPEEIILMRALRDFNLPKIVTEDVEVFMGLIGDLFPKASVPRKVNRTLESAIKIVTAQSKLVPEENFVLKVVQLQELLDVRHSVFIIGPPGSSKTQVWRMLAKARDRQGAKCQTPDINPKAVSNHELFGYQTPATREWHDGLLSSIMRTLSEIPNQEPKWIILDGDIDPMWIESMNTVMDDNKILTLASNERIPLHPWMRLIFEIGHIKYGSPATVSRAGILFINETDVGWNPFVQCWIERREQTSLRNTLVVLFDRYVATSLNYIKKNFRHLVPTYDFTMVQTLCYILEILLTPKVSALDKEIIEIYFVFACIWAFGSALLVDQIRDCRVEFNKWWRQEWKHIKFPDQGTVFDYYIEPETHKWVPWTQLVPEYVHDPDIPLPSVLVHTPETTRIMYWMDLFLQLGRPVLLVGGAGCGKTMLIKERIAALPQEQFMNVNMNFNFQTSSKDLQFILEQPLIKIGKKYGPPNNKKLIFFIDDLNMPEVDLYGTQAPHTLMRMHIDYNHWYDRQKMFLREVGNCQYICAMNPTTGSFTIDPRLQRHFVTMAVNFPDAESIKHIATSLLEGHFSNGFSGNVLKTVPKVVSAMMDIHKRVSATFLPTAIKFHYQFNLRDLANVMGGLQQATPEVVRNPLILARMFKHEATRVYADRLTSLAEWKQFDTHMDQVMDASFSDCGDKESRNAMPLTWAPFAGGTGQRQYGEVAGGLDGLKKILEESLDLYNEANAAMDLVLFEDAMYHVARIARIIDRPNGNALLVGVGGSGKQSLARLAAFSAQFDVFQITISSTYGVNELKDDLKQLFFKAGLKDQQMCFLFTDTQIVDERFLIYINDVLSSGWIADLFATEDKDNIVNGVTTDCKASGIPPTRDNCLNFFTQRVRANLHLILCFSPVGDAFRQRARKFPAIVSCTSIDWFHPWPQEALLSVGKRFLADVELGTDEEADAICHFMAYTNTTVNEVSEQFLASERRYNYTTPKSFLELINLYKSMLEQKRADIEKKIERFENGLIKLEDTSKQVAELQNRLVNEQKVVEQKQKDADELLEKVGQETNIVEEEQKIARVEEEKANVIARDVEQQEAECKRDLARAEPAILEAEAALNTLNKPNLTELKSLASPPSDVVDVGAAVLILMSPPSGVARDLSWNSVKKMMGQVDRFLEQLQTFDKDHIPPANLKAVQPYLDRESFNGDSIMKKSVAAAGLCKWVINIVKYYYIYCDVQPKREKLAAAQETLAEARAKLEAVQAKVDKLNKKLKALTDQFEAATEEKNEVIRQAKETQNKLNLAHRLVNGLASEAVRWRENVDAYKKQATTLVGDVLLASAFISYVGPFTKKYRTELMENKWMPFMKENKIPCSEDLDVMSLLTDDAQIAQWNNEGLPTDRLSVENAVISTTCERWPLFIDPQLQGIAWIRNRYGDELQVARMGAPRYLDRLENAIQNGEPYLFENLGETLEAVIDPVIGRNLIRKGKQIRIKIGDKTIDYDKKFKLFLQTKLSNPHYRPEIQAQTTIINFTVTEEGLEDQLLALVVKREKPELEQQKAELMQQQNEFKIRLKELEDSLLANLTNAQGDILSNVELIEGLEVTKATATEIKEKVALAKETEANINSIREAYRPVANRAALIYFLINDLWKIDHMYQFSLKAFIVVFYKAMDAAAESEEISERVASLVESVTFTTFCYVNRALFVKHKLIFITQLCIKIARRQNLIDPEQLDYLLRGRKLYGQTSPVEWLTESNWAAVWALKEVEGFKGLPSDIEGSQKRWKEWCDHESPETEKLPQEWKNKSTFEKLCVIRALRSDRMTYAIQMWIEETMGKRYVDAVPFKMEATFAETSPSSPMFFILSPGIDPVKDVEALGRKLNYTTANGKFKLVSMGQGQEPVAEEYIDRAAAEGSWVMLENLHLMSKWLITVEKKLEWFAEAAKPESRVFLSAEPSNDPLRKIPQGILQNAIKVTNEPPLGMKANMRRAFACFDQENLESCTKVNEYKSILFALCFFHAAILERKKFGPQGWNISYPFNLGDLTISSSVLYNYLENNQKIPWVDLRYMFGEIMYGGHISDDWDRRLCRTYLEVLMREDLFNGMELGPGFPEPPPGTYDEYSQYIEEALPPESPYLFGLHPNAEIGFLTEQADSLFQTILSLQPRDANTGEGETAEEKVSKFIEELLQNLPEGFDMPELYARVQERTPYVSVCLQECDRMNILLNIMKTTLKELALGLKGDLSMSDSMSTLMNSIFMDQVPDSWAAKAYPSLKSLPAWIQNLTERIRQLQEWSLDLNLPKSVWLSGLFNPQSFLTAVMQTTSRKNQWPLDKMVLQTDITRKSMDDLASAPREGAYIHGLFLEGARLDPKSGYLAESHLMELRPSVPIIFVRAILIEKREVKDVYHCPVYRTRRRGPTYVWEFTLKTKLPESKWVLAGVAMLLDAD